MNYDNEYYDKKWTQVISLLPHGGQYRFDLRQQCYDLIKEQVKEGDTIFDYACGLGLIDIQLEKEKNCKVYGCDFSVVAINYINSQVKTNFKVGSRIYQDSDVMLAIYFLEHIDNPVEWCHMALKKTKKIIAALPNDFRAYGEHIDMQWKDWDSFNELFKDFKMTRLDGENYTVKPDCYRHPVFEIKAKKKKYDKTSK